MAKLRPRRTVYSYEEIWGIMAEDGYYTLYTPVDADLDAWEEYIDEGLDANQMPETTDIRFTEVTSGQQEKA